MKQKLHSVIILFFIGYMSLYAQKNELLSIVKRSNKPSLAKIHLYELKLKNNTDKKARYTLKVDAKKCINKNKSNSKLLVNLYNEEMKPLKNGFYLDKNESIKFYLKSVKPNNLSLNSWSCADIKVYQGINGNLSKESDSLTIEFFIPDPNNDN